MNKGIISIIAAVILLIASIISGILFFGCAGSPDGTDSLQKLIDGCNKKSETQIAKSLHEKYEEMGFSTSIDFSKCVTPDDYLGIFGCSFDYMYEDDNETEKFYIVGTKEEEITDEIKESFNYYFGDVFDGDKLSIFHAYLAADYKDADGNSQTAITTLGVVALDGKLLGFVNI